LCSNRKQTRRRAEPDKTEILYTFHGKNERGRNMTDLNVQEILNKVRENKELLERKSEELDLALAERDQLQARIGEMDQELTALREELARTDALREELDLLRQHIIEKDNAIQDLLMQNADLQEKVTETESRLKQQMVESKDKEALSKNSRTCSADLSRSIHTKTTGAEASLPPLFLIELSLSRFPRTLPRASEPGIFIGCVLRKPARTRQACARRR
jgi:chromosome segregation ATPase